MFEGPMRGRWLDFSSTCGAQEISLQAVFLTTKLYCLENCESK